jgi:hypothetical protein
MCFVPGANALKQVNRGEYSWDEPYYAMCYDLRDFQHLPKEVSDGLNGLVFEGYSGHLLFYLHRIQTLYNRELRCKKISELLPGDQIMLSQAKILNELKAGGTRANYMPAGAPGY